MSEIDKSGQTIPNSSYVQLYDYRANMQSIFYGAKVNALVGRIAGKDFVVDYVELIKGSRNHLVCKIDTGGKGKWKINSCFKYDPNNPGKQTPFKITKLSDFEKFEASIVKFDESMSQSFPILDSYTISLCNEILSLLDTSTLRKKAGEVDFEDLYYDGITIADLKRLDPRLKGRCHPSDNYAQITSTATYRRLLNYRSCPESELHFNPKLGERKELFFGGWEVGSRMLMAQTLKLPNSPKKYDALRTNTGFSMAVIDGKTFLLELAQKDWDDDF